MKRCPQCNRVETDESLKFCRVDGATLVSDLSAAEREAATIQLGSSAPNESATDNLPQTTDRDLNRDTAPTTVLPPQPAARSFNESRLTTRRRLNSRRLA